MYSKRNILFILALLFQPLLCAQHPSPFAQATLPLLSQESNLLELGCGDGSDALYFAENGINVYACDSSEAAISKLTTPYELNNPTFFVGDLANLGSKLGKTKIGAVYSHFTLDNLSNEDTIKVIKWTFNHLQPNGLFFIETQSIHHPQLVDNLKKAGFTILNAIESTSFSISENEDSPITRIMALK